MHFLPCENKANCIIEENMWKYWLESKKKKKWCMAMTFPSSTMPRSWCRGNRVPWMKQQKKAKFTSPDRNFIQAGTCGQHSVLSKTSHLRGIATECLRVLAPCEDYDELCRQQGAEQQWRCQGDLAGLRQLCWGHCWSCDPGGEAARNTRAGQAKVVMTRKTSRRREKSQGAALPW